MDKTHIIIAEEIAESELRKMDAEFFRAYADAIDPNSAQRSVDAQGAYPQALVRTAGKRARRRARKSPPVKTSAAPRTIEDAKR